MEASLNLLVPGDVPWPLIFLFSSIRSSNSHPDLLVTQHHHPTFSDTHQSSILDFHFLSHYSNIKGNHWTHQLATCIPYVQDSARKCKLVHNQCIINSCWQSVPLPCGHYKAIFIGIPIARYNVYTLASEQRQMLAQRLTVMGGGWNVMGKRVGPSAITTLQVQIQIQIGVQI